MTGGELSVVLVVLIPSIGAALGYLMKASREAGRADEYRRTTEETIKEMKQEALEAKATIKQQADEIARLKAGSP